MFPIEPKYHPRFMESIGLLILLISLISYFIIGLGTVPHIPILLAIFILIAYGNVRKITYADLEAALVSGARSGLGAVFLFFLIGILISSWMISGTIPALITAGFSFIGSTWFYAIVFAITSIIGVSLGTSLTTTATVGVAFIGMASALDMSLAITAGTIVSGAFFGDKMSPLSDTTNLASAIVGVDLFAHIKYISLTTIPAFIISFILFAILSPDAAVSNDDLRNYQEALHGTGLIHIASWIPLIILMICTIYKVPALVALAITSIIASIIANIFNGISWTDIWGIWFNGYVSQTGYAPVDELLTRGGINSMLFTISLVLLTLAFGGLLFVTGLIPSILMALQQKLKKLRSVVISTAVTAIGVNVFIGEQYLSILLTGETYKSIYQQMGIPKKVLSRTVEDAGTVINPLVPWSVCGVFIADVLQVSVIEYLPFAFFCLLSPIITVIFNGRNTQKLS